MNITGLNKFREKIFFLLSKNTILVGIVLLALFLRLYKIWNKDLWYDEVLDILQSQKSVIEIFNDVKLTPLHYLFTHFFSLFSNNIVFLRIPSIIFGILSIIALYVLTRKWSSRSVALLSAFLFAISPMAIEFSQQILHYSSFLFFTLISLYFYLDILLEKKFKVQTIFLFLFFTACNLASHISSFIIIAVEGLFFILYYTVLYKEFWQKLKSFMSTKKGVFVVILFFMTFLAIMIKSDYVRIMHAFTTFDLSKPIKVGFSLTNQLHSEYITYPSIQFMLALFAWMGLGTGIRLYMYLILLLIGGGYLLRKPRILTFIIFWILMPIILLFLVKIDHWFEEKYLIFILPIYLWGVSFGAVYLTSLFNKLLKIPILVSIVILFLILAYNPVRSRTTYGFNDINVSGYNWLEVFSHIPKSDSDVVFSLDDLYLRVYLGEKGRYKDWYTDEYLAKSSPSEYQSLVDNPKSFYYTSIPDLINLRSGNLVNQEKIGIFGNINLYKIKFVKTSPIEFDGFFADTFIKLDYLKNASDWNNVLVSFRDFIIYKNKFENDYQPQFLVPSSKENSFISYKFRLKKNQASLFLKMGYVVKDSNNKIEVSITTATKKRILTQSVSQENASDYTEEIYDLSEFKNNPEIEITFSFSQQNFEENNFSLGLKYFELYNTPADAISLTQLDQKFTYHSLLEGNQTTSWLKDTLQNYGWWQTSDGVLYKSIDKENPLIYKFTLPKQSSSAKLFVDTFTIDNGLLISMSNDGESFQDLASIIDEQKYLPHEYELDSSYIQNKNTLFIRIDSKKTGPKAILRNIKLEIQ